MSNNSCSDILAYQSTNDNKQKLVLLVRDPKCIFAYWSINQEVVDRVKKDFSVDIMQKSYRVLKIKNITLNYSFYIYINEYSDSWYIDVEHPDCLYSAEIGLMIRHEYFVSLACSNTISTPAIRESNNKSAYFANYSNMNYICPDSDNSKQTLFEQDKTVSSLFLNLPSSADLLESKSPANNRQI